MIMQKCGFRRFAYLNHLDCVLRMTSEFRLPDVLITRQNDKQVIVIEIMMCPRKNRTSNTYLYLQYKILWIEFRLQKN